MCSVLKGSISERAGYCQLKKMHNPKLENYSADFLRTQVREAASQIALRDCFKEIREEPGYIGVFCNKAR